MFQTFINSTTNSHQYTLYESINTVFGIVVELIFQILLLCLSSFLSKKGKEYKDELTRLETNPTAMGNEYELFDAYICQKETVHHSVRGEPDSYWLITVTPDVGSYKVIKLRCSDTMGLKFKIGEQITIRKQKKAQSLYDFKIVT